MLLRSARRVLSRHSPLASAFASASRSASTVSALLHEAAAEFPHRDTLRHPPAAVKYTSTDVLTNTTALANGFGELSLQAGDRIVTILPLSGENLLTNLAAACVGVEVIPVTPKSANELQSVLAKSGAKLVIFHPDANSLIEELLPEETAEQLYVKAVGTIEDERFPNLDYLVTLERPVTESNVLNFGQIMMIDAEIRCHVKKNAGKINEDTPLVAGLTNKDVIAAADRAISKLNIDSEAQLTLSAASPQAMMVAGTIALQTHAQLHLESDDVNNAIDIQDTSFA